jgi:hypothetical protein
MPVKSKPKKSLIKVNSNQSKLLQLLATSDDARDTVRTMLKVKQSPDHWRGLIATPPGSLLETVITAFHSATDIPLEIPFFATLHFLSANLLARGITLDFAGQVVRPDLWSVILAESGSGKTYATNIIEKFLDQPATFPEPASSAKFIEDLARHNNSMWIRDEFAHFLKALDTQPQLAELRDYLLRVYDGKTIERNTKKTQTKIDDPALCILGLSVLESFKNVVTAESMIDGFSQRFSYIIAKRDTQRHMKDYPIYDMRPHQDKIKSDWNEVISSIKHEKYIVGSNAETAFRESFSLLMPPLIDVPPSFYRRIMLRGVRYALLYHVLLRKETDTLDAVDLGWAGRVCALHVKDAAWLIGDHGLPDLERLCLRAEDVRERVLKEEGRPVTPRDIVRLVHGVKNVGEARALLSMI